MFPFLVVKRLVFEPLVAVVLYISYLFGFFAELFWLFLFATYSDILNEMGHCSRKKDNGL